MGFDFFKKKKGRGGDSSDHSDELQFDDIETSGEFLSGSEDSPAPSQDPYPAAPPPPPPPPPPPAYQQPPVQPSTYPDDDITIINRPPVVPPAPSGATPAPPGPPAAPGPPRAPAAPAPAAAPGPPAPAQPEAAPPMPPVGNAQDGLAADEVTQVLNKPVSISAVVAWLVVVEGPLRGEDYRLPSGTIRLGLNPACEIHLPGDTFISSQHAEISFRNGAYWLRDLGSTNGLFVNGTRVSEIALNDGDEVKAGKTRMIYKSLVL